MTYAAYARACVRFTKGSPVDYRSSAFAVRGHCAACGSPLTYSADADPDTLWLAVGSLDDPDLVPPTEDWYVAAKLSWVPVDEALAKCADAPAED